LQIAAPGRRTRRRSVGEALARRVLCALVMDARRVLLVVEDDALGELLDELLREAGHDVARVTELTTLERAAGRFDAVVVDLDTRTAAAPALVERARRAGGGAARLVAILPCGGLPGGGRPAGCDRTIEKPARLGAVLAAIAN